MILVVLLKHYRRHPMQALFLLSGVVIANVLLVGTQLINAQARASYEQGERILGAGPRGEIFSTDRSNLIDEREFVALRLKGFHRTAPLLRSYVTTDRGSVLELLGVDALSMPASTSSTSSPVSEGDASDVFDNFAFPPYALLAAPARIDQLGIEEGTELRLTNGNVLPPLRAVRSGELGHRLLLDIGALQEASNQRGQLSSILVFETDPERIAALERTLPDTLMYEPGESGPDPAQLTQSLHLNLAAMGLLAAVVGLFLTYNAISFSYTDRRELLRRLRLAGVARRQLRLALILELGVFLLVGCTIGVWLGAVLASRLLPGLGLTLAQLYDVYIGYPDALISSAWAVPVLSTITAALACAWVPLRGATAGPVLSRWSSQWELNHARQRDHRFLFAGVASLAMAALASQLATSIWQALAGMAMLLLGAALCLPTLLRSILRLFDRSLNTRAVHWNWLVADSRWLLGPAALALMAMTLALVANSGLNTMIGSFRSATEAWLEQRLAAQLYLRGDAIAKFDTEAEFRRWQNTQHDGVKVTERHRQTISLTTPAGLPMPVELIDLAPYEPFRSSVQLIDSRPDSETRFFSSAGVFVSERAWRLNGWQLDDQISICPSALSVPVVGIYNDYGNPSSQIMVSQQLFQTCWPELPPTGIGIHGPAELDWSQIRASLLEAFGLRASDILDQVELKQVGLRVFDRTFAITQALNSLTLIVAGIGIFCSISAIHHHRIGQQALLASLGLSRRERGWMLLAQWGLLGLLCTLIVAPFGTILAWYLAQVVTPVAFGWSFPLRLEFMPYLTLLLTAAGAFLLAVLVPAVRLTRVSPASLLREQVA